MQNQLLRLRMEREIAIIEIDSPPLNIITDDLLTELDTVTEKIRNVRALVITGTGDKAFVAGADIQQFPSLNRESGIALVEKGKRIFDRIAAFPFPVICAINGVALGGGLELALACDIRIAEKQAKLGLPEAKLGVLPGYGGTQRLTRLVGSGKAKELIFTGEYVSSNESLQMGLVERVVSPGAALEEAIDLAKKMSANGPQAIASAKRVIDEGLGLPLHEAQKLESEQFGILCETGDMQEGVQAFMEKRTPAFQGK